MRTRTFSEQEKEEIKQRLKEIGFPMLKEQGLIHMSISKLAAGVGIGKSTFYSFYSSKEEFVEDMLGDNRKKIMQALKQGLNGREKYSVEESKAIVRKMVRGLDTVYKNFSLEDETAIMKMYEAKGIPYVDLEKEKKVIDFITSLFDGVKEKLDYAVIANLMKMIAFSFEHKDMLHESGMERTIDKMVGILIDCIFEK